MGQTTNNTKRLAKNTAFMYIRMSLLMIISLYTERIILKTLGITDYGIYNVIGSIVILFNSLRSVFASSTRRFLNYEMGKGNTNNLNKIFNISIQINTLVAIIFFILVEAIGLWFVHTQMSVPTDRIMAVRWLLQFSIAGAILAIFTTSFDALIIAHERMDFYAYMSIVEGGAKLFIAFIIGYYGGEKLILYGLLIMATGALVLFCNYLFCRNYFPETRFRCFFDKDYIIKMSKFAGWNFFGNTAFSLSQNGMNMVLNVFGGPVVNGARGITYQVNGALNQIINNIGIVINPFMVKTYAEGNMKKAFHIVYLSSKIYFLIQICLVTVFTFFAPEIIQLWLGQTPPYVTSFLTIILWYSLVRAIHLPLNMLFIANGNLRNYQLCEGFVLSLPLLAAYLLLRNGMPYATAFLSMLVFEIINLGLILIIAQRQCDLSLTTYLRKVGMPCAICSAIYALCYYIHINMAANTMMGISIACMCIILSIISMYIELDEEEKGVFQVLIRQVRKKE